MVRRRMGIVASLLVAAACASSGSGSGSTSRSASFCSTWSLISEPARSTSSADRSSIAEERSRLLDELVQEAPAEIASDMQLVADSQKRSLYLLDASTASNASDYASIASAQADYSRSFDSKKVATATVNVVAFGKNKCGIDLLSLESSSS